jgi:hypothetical protein
MKQIIITLLLIISFLPLAQYSYAGTEVEITPPQIYIEGEGDSVLPTPSGTLKRDVTTVDVILDKILVPFINMLSNVFIGLAVVFLVFGGLQYVLAHGDEEKIKKSHRSIVWAVFGILLVMFSYTIVYILNYIFPTS